MKSRFLFSIFGFNGTGIEFQLFYANDKVFFHYNIQQGSLRIPYKDQQHWQGCMVMAHGCFSLQAYTGMTLKYQVYMQFSTHYQLTMSDNSKRIKLVRQATYFIKTEICILFIFSLPFSYNSMIKSSLQELNC